MKKIFFAILVSLCASAFAMDFDYVSAGKNKDVTSDMIFVGQCSSTKELSVILEKAYKTVFDSTSVDTNDMVKRISSKFETQKTYDATLAKNNAADIFDDYHMDYSYNVILSIISKYKSALQKEKAIYYMTMMKSGKYNGYLFVYEATTKKVYMEYLYNYTQDYDDWY